MAQDNSFDIVSKVDIQEVRNAIDQALKEIRQRFDLKDSHSEINLEGDEEIQLASAGEYIWKRSRRFWPEAGQARRLAEESDLRQGGAGRWARACARRSACSRAFPSEKAKEIVRLVKDSKRKAQVSIQGDTVRVPARTATSCRRSSRCCAAKSWAWSCSSPTTAPIKRTCGWQAG